MLNPATTFRDAKKVGAGWMAKCPAHDDRKASLSIGIGDAGRILLKCHAGCELDDILAAAHCEHADLFADTSTPTKPTIVATYPYIDEGGRHLYDVVRFEPKDFRQRRADGLWKMHGVRRVLYHLAELQGQSTAYIVEGEKDADRLRAIGFPGTTNAGGAGKWKPEYVGQLKAAAIEHVVVLPDDDDPGRAHAEHVAQSCHAAGLLVKVVQLPDLPVKGDVSDWLDAGHTKVELAALVKAAPLYAPTAPAATAPVPAVITPEPVLIRLDNVATEAIDWLWPHRFARGKYTLLAGDPGKGKSRLTFDMAARITRGAPWPDGGHAPLGTVLFLLAEDGLGDTVKPAIESMGGDVSRVFILDGIRDEHGTRPFNLARDLAALETAIAQVQPQIVFIDPITAYLGKTDSYKDSEVRGLLVPVLAAAARHRTALGAVAHLSKDAQRAALHRPGGSVAFVAAARLVFALAADPNDEDRRVLAPLKTNICTPAPILAFRLPDGRLAWEAGPVQGLDADAILRPAGPQEREERGDAETLVRELLADGPAHSTAVLNAAEANGISRRQLFAAKARLGVRATRVGGLGKNGRWIWALTIPDDPLSPTDTDNTLSVSKGLTVSNVSNSINSLALTKDANGDGYKF